MAVFRGDDREIDFEEEDTLARSRFNQGGEDESEADNLCSICAEPVEDGLCTGCSEAEDDCTCKDEDPLDSDSADSATGEGKGERE